MENSKKDDNRGQHMVRAWEEAKKAGGISYSPEQIETILEERSDMLLTREEVKSRITAYFGSCLTVTQDEDSGELSYIWKRNPTKSGLAMALNVSPQTLIDYIKGSDRHGNQYKEYCNITNRQRINTSDFDLLRKAYTLIEDFYEQKLGDNRNNAGVIFWLNNKENTRWSNEQEFKFGTVDVEKTRSLSASELPKLEQVPASLLPKLDEEDV